MALAVFRDLTLDSKRSTNLSQQLLSRLQSTPAVVERLKSEPEQVIADLQELRKACKHLRKAGCLEYHADGCEDSVTSTKGMRIAVTGDILSMSSPVSAWKEHFHNFEVCTSA